MLIRESRLKVSKKTYTADQFRFSKKTFKIGASAKTALSFKVTSGSKYISVNQKGQVTIKRWTPKGTYKISVTAKATDEYKKAAKTVTVQVKAGTVMSKAGVKWDLKKNKTIKAGFIFEGDVHDFDESSAYHSKMGYIKLKKYKKVKSGNNYKVTCTILFTYPTKSQFSNDEISEFSRSVEYFNRGPAIYYTVADVQTGECLECKNHYGVKCKDTGFKFSGEQKIVNKYGDGISIPKTGEVTFSVTYPKSYKNLCILAGSYVSNDGNASDRYWKGKYGFEKSELCGLGKNQCHGMRVK